MAGTFVARLKRPFLRIRRCRSLKVGSNELHLQESNGAADAKLKTSPPSSHDKTYGGVEEGDRYSLGHHSSSPAVDVATARKAAVEPLVDGNRRKSDEWRRRRRRTFDGGKGRMCRDGSLQTLFRETESSSEASSDSSAPCGAPILRKLSSLFGTKKQVEGAKGLRVSCIQGLDWSSSLQNYKPMGYKLFSKRKRSLTLVRCKKEVPILEDSVVSRSGGGGSLKTSPRRTPGRELTSSPMSPPVTLARSEEACPFVLEDTSVYDERIHLPDTTKASSPSRSLSPISRDSAMCPNNYDDEDDSDDLGMEEDDSYLRKYAGVPQSPSVVFCIRPRRYTLAPSRFQREHLERLRNAAKVSPSRRNSGDL